MKVSDYNLYNGFDREDVRLLEKWCAKILPSAPKREIAEHLLACYQGMKSGLDPALKLGFSFYWLAEYTDNTKKTYLYTEGFTCAYNTVTMGHIYVNTELDTRGAACTTVHDFSTDSISEHQKIWKW